MVTVSIAVHTTARLTKNLTAPNTYQLSDCIVNFKFYFILIQILWWQSPYLGTISFILMGCQITLNLSLNQI